MFDILDNGQTIYELIIHTYMSFKRLMPQNFGVNTGYDNCLSSQSLLKL